MSTFYGGRRRKTSLSVLIPYVLVFLIGLSTGYAIWGFSSKPAAPAPIKTASNEAGKTPPETPAPQTAASEPVTKEPPKSVETTPPPAKPEATTPPAPVTPASTEGEKSAEPETKSPLDDLAEVWPGRHLFIAIKGDKLDDPAKAMLREVKPGGVVLLGANIKNRAQVIKLVSDIKDAVGLGKTLADLPLIAVDQEGGKVNRLRLENAPSAAELGAKDDAEAKKVGSEYAAACVARGIGVILAPVLDIYEKGVSPDMFENRSFGSDGKSVTTHGLAFATGVMEGGVIAVAKHFPGHGASSQDTHEALAVLDRSGYELAKVMFPFAEAARVGVPGIMVGHISVPVFENGLKRPASLSPILIKTVLRERLGFRGVVIADNLDMGAIKNVTPMEDAVVGALAAGCDSVMYLDPNPERIKAACAAINDAVTAGKLTRKGLAESIARLDGWQTWLRKPQGSPEAAPATVVAKGPASTAPELPLSPEQKSDANPVKSETKSATKPETKPEPSAPEPKVETLAPPATKSDAKPETKPETKPEQVVPDVPPTEEAAPAKNNTELPVDITKDGTYFVDGKPVDADKLAEVLKGQSEENKKKTLLIRPDPSLNKSVGKKVLDAAKAAGFTHQGVTSLTESRANELAIAAKAEEAQAAAASPAPPAPAAPAPVQGPLGWPFSTPGEAPAPKPAPDPAPAATPASETPATPTPTPAPAPAQEPATSAPAPTVYEVQKGDSLTKIAAKFGVKQSDLQAWNHIEGEGIQAGQKLAVQKPDDAASAETAKKDAKTKEDKAKEEKAAEAKKKEDAAAQDAEAAKKDKEKKKDKDAAAKEDKKNGEKDAQQPPNTKKVMHEIQPGEMLSKIAAKYGVKQKDIIAWNKLADDDIKYGRKLVIYMPADAPEPGATPPPAAPAPKEVTPQASSEPTPAPAPETPAPAPAPSTDTPPPAASPAPAAKESAPAAPAASAPPPDGVKWIHTTAKGQKLVDIAAQYGVSVESIKQWNNLSGDDLKKGQKLNVYLSPTANPENANVERADKGDKGEKTSGPPTQPYLVQAGDTFDKIAEKYNITRAELLELNRMNNASQLRPGQRLKVPKQP